MGEAWFLYMVIDDDGCRRSSTVGVFDSLEQLEDAKEQFVTRNHCYCESVDCYGNRNGLSFEFRTIPFTRNVTKIENLTWIRRPILEEFL